MKTIKKNALTDSKSLSKTSKDWCTADWHSSKRRPASGGGISGNISAEDDECSGKEENALGIERLTVRLIALLLLLLLPLLLVVRFMKALEIKPVRDVDRSGRPLLGELALLEEVVPAPLLLLLSTESLRGRDRLRPLLSSRVLNRSSPSPVSLTLLRS